MNKVSVPDAFHSNMQNVVFIYWIILSLIPIIVIKMGEPHKNPDIALKTLNLNIPDVITSEQMN